MQFVFQELLNQVVSKLAEYVCDKDGSCDVPHVDLILHDSHDCEDDPRGSLAPGNPSGW